MADPLTPVEMSAPQSLRDAAQRTLDTQRPDPLAALLHDLYVSGPPYGCEHDLGPVGDYVPRCIEDAARLRAAGAAVHAITPECGPICWTTGHHHDVETCDGCRRLADMMHAAGTALATGVAAGHVVMGLGPVLDPPAPDPSDPLDTEGLLTGKDGAA